MKKILLLIAIVALVIFFPYNVLQDCELFCFKIDISAYEKLGQYLSGVTSIIGTLISLITIYFVYATFKNQANDSKKMSAHIEKQQSDSKENLKIANRKRFEDVFLSEMLPRKDKIIKELNCGLEDGEIITGEQVIQGMVSVVNKINNCKRLLLNLGLRIGNTKSYDRIREIIVGEYLENHKNDKIIYSLFMKYGDKYIDPQNAGRNFRDLADEAIKARILAEFDYFTLGNYAKFIKILLNYILKEDLEESVLTRYIDIFNYFLTSGERVAVFIYIVKSKDNDFKMMADQVIGYNKIDSRTPYHDIYDLFKKEYSSL